MLGTERPALSYGNDQLRPLASSTQRKATSRRNLNTATVVEPAKDSTPNPIYSQTLAEAITTAMSKGLEPLLAAKETKNKPTKYRGTRDGKVDGWLMLMKRYLQKAHAKDTPLDKAWTIVEFLENEARDYITNKSEAERDTDEKVFALLARRFGTGSNKIQIQQQFRTRNQSPDEDYMQNLDALEGLRSQGFPNEEVAVRRYEIMQRFIEGVRSFELKRNLALMYAQEQYVDTPPTVEALRFTVQQYCACVVQPVWKIILHHSNNNNSRLSQQTNKTRCRHRPRKRLLPSTSHNNLRLSDNNRSEHASTAETPRIL